MATVYREFTVSATPAKAWHAIRDVGGINKLITMLGEVTVEGDHRTCELRGMGHLRERIVSIDDERRRVAYTILESPFNFEHHSASMQIAPNGGSGARFIWTSDVKPDAVTPQLTEAIDAAVESLKTTLR